MSNLIPRTAWWLLAAGIAWQAALGAFDLGSRLWRSRDVGVTQRLGGTTDERLAKALGPDFVLATALRDVARPNEHVLYRIAEFTAAAFAEPDGIVPRLTRLRHAVFPQPHLMQPPADPIATAEALPAGQSVLLLVLGADPRPQEGAGWRRLHVGTNFEIWRFQR